VFFDIPCLNFPVLPRQGQEDLKYQKNEPKKNPAGNDGGWFLTAFWKI
jgi:hypothetical protein